MNECVEKVEISIPIPIRFDDKRDKKKRKVWFVKSRKERTEQRERENEMICSNDE